MNTDAYVIHGADVIFVNWSQGKTTVAVDGS